MLKKLGISHGTVVAYAALFFAFGGTGYAATQIVASSGGVKVRCSASHNHKHLSCKVVKGSGVGPRGPRGAQGPPGPGGAYGPTVLTQSPAFTISPGGTIDLSGGTLSAGDEQQGWTAGSTAPPSAPTTQTDTFVTYLLSPSEIAGGGTHLASVQFCYGAFANTDAAYAEPAGITITHATVYENTEPATSGTTPVGAPPYSSPTPLVDASLSLTGGYGCKTLTPATPPAIAAGGYLSLDVTASFSSEGYYHPGASSYEYPSAPIYFGRVTTTYSP
jgi:hypothetical protein